MKTTICLIALAALGSAQSLDYGRTAQSGAVYDLRSATRTAILQTGTSLPATCTVGDGYFKTDSTAGQNIHICTSTNTWTQVTGGGSMTYPGAGVPKSLGSSWDTSYTVGTGANNLVQLNGSGQLPAVSGALLTNLPAPSALASNPTDCSANQFANAIAANGNLTCAALAAADIPASLSSTTSVNGTTIPASKTLMATDTSATLSQLPAGVKKRSFGAVFDGGGSALTARDSPPQTIPFACTISAWNIMADAGTATFKVWKVATGTAIPTVSNSINTSGVSLSTGTAVRSTTLTDFTSTAVAANDIFRISLTAVATATQVTVSVECDQ